MNPVTKGKCRKLVFKVVEQRHAENQAALQAESQAASEQGNSVVHGEPSRRPVASHETGPFSLNLSFEELSGAGLEEPPRRSNNSHWPVSLLVRSFKKQCVKTYLYKLPCRRDGLG